MKQFLERCSLVFGIGVLILLLVLFVVRHNNQEQHAIHAPSIIEDKVVEVEVPIVEEQEPQEMGVFVDSVLDAPVQQGDVSTDDMPQELPEEVSQDDAIYEPVTLSRVEKYYNTPLEYGFLLPYGNYYSGFGAQDGAQHTVGISDEGVPDTFADAQVQVLYFLAPQDVPEDAQLVWNESNTVAYESSDTIYIQILDTTYVQVRGQIDSDTARAIVQTIFVGAPTQEVDPSQIPG